MKLKILHEIIDSRRMSPSYKDDLILFQGLTQFLGELASVINSPKTSRISPLRRQITTIVNDWLPYINTNSNKEDILLLDINNNASSILNDIQTIPDAVISQTILSQTMNLYKLLSQYYKDFTINDYK